MAWTIPTTRSTGEVITASIWNTDLVNDLIDIYSSGRIHTAATQLSFGAAVRTNSYVYLAGSFAPAGAAFVAGLDLSYSLTGVASQNIYGVYVAPTLVEAASGVHTLEVGTYFAIPTITAGAATATDAATVYIAGAPSATVTGGNWALWVAAGTTKFDGQVTHNQPATGTRGAIFNAITGATVPVLEIQYNATIVGGYYVNASTSRFDVGSDPLVGVGRNLGNNVGGPFLFITRNTNAGTEGPAAGALELSRAGGGDNYLWVDNSAAPGKLRIHTGQPTGSSGTPTVSDTAGTVVGDQTSPHWLKRPARGTWEASRHDPADALAAIMALRVYDWSYREESPSYQRPDGTAHEFTGVVLFDNDIANGVWYGKGYGRQQIPALNEISLHGYEILAIQQLHRRVAALEDRRIPA